MKTGVILNNIGTPESFDPKDVKIYLDEFLMDPDVIGLPFPLRWILVKGIITPRRSHSSAEKYRSVWMQEGSPLMVFSKAFHKALQEELGANWVLRLGMRYGNPSLRESLEELRKAQVEKVVLAPMFPQFAEATSGSAIKETKRLMKEMNWPVPFEELAPFHEEKGFLSPQAELVRKAGEVDHVLFSFHGLPQSQIHNGKGCEATSNGRENPEACEIQCYQAQCVKTAQDLAKELNLSRDQWSHSFQSRLGPAKWIGPATDDVLKALPAQGRKSVAVVCPAFVADCIETLEEIGIEGKKEFLHAGGKDYRLVPCVNAENSWVRGFAEILRSRHSV